MKPPFTPYDVVRVKSRSQINSAVVTDYKFRWVGESDEESEVVFTLCSDQGQIFEAVADDMERIGRVEPPLQDDEVVEVLIRGEPAYEKEGIVKGAAWNPKTNEWGYAVLLQDGHVWSFMENELKGTGKISPANVEEA